jgi:hypothetical protein
MTGEDRRARPITKPPLTRRGVIAAGALAAGGVVLVGAPRLAGSASAEQDARVLNFVLLLEEVEAGFYAEARARGRLSGELAQFVDIVGGHEREHVAFLRQALGSKARAKPRLGFGDATSNEKRFVASSIALEDNSVAAYNGQAANLSAEALGAAARIVSVEARHAAWIRDIAGRPPAARATDPPRTQAQALAAIRKLGFLR